MADPLLVNILTSIQQALCCIANSSTDCTAPIRVKECAGEPDVQFLIFGMISSTPVAVSLPQDAATSLEFENFSEADWLQVMLPNARTFYVPPGGSKTIAFSTPSALLAGSATVASCSDPEGTAGFTAPFIVQVTSINQP